MYVRYVLVLDAIGENHSGLIGQFESGKIKDSISIPIEESIGLIYSLVTVYCGFKVLTGEYKLMGLAPYGNPRYLEILNQLFWDSNLNKPSIADINIYDSILQSKSLEEQLLFPPRDINSNVITQDYADLAASVQTFLEQKVCYILRDYIGSNKLEDSRCLVLSGGVALNCKLNYIISEYFADNFDKVWAYPASGDAGSSVGACMAYLTENTEYLKNIEIEKSTNMFLGSKYTNSEVICNNYSILYHTCSDDPVNKENLIYKVCKLLQEGKIGAIYEDRTEFGPRALGNRSIIADARNANALKSINRNVKNREDFRPLAPIVLETEAHKYFELNERCRDMYNYMLCLAKSRNFDYNSSIFEEQKSSDSIKPKSSRDSLIPAVVHHDGTARIQTISADDKTIICDVLKSYLKSYNIGLLINTLMLEESRRQFTY